MEHIDVSTVHDTAPARCADNQTCCATIDLVVIAEPCISTECCGGDPTAVKWVYMRRRGCALHTPSVISFHQTTY